MDLRLRSNEGDAPTPPAPLRAGALGLAGPAAARIARSLQIHEGYARRSRLANQPQSPSKMLKLFLRDS